jgi:hypothetical protein
LDLSLVHLKQISYFKVWTIEKTPNKGNSKVWAFHLLAPSRGIFLGWVLTVFRVTKKQVKLIKVFY